MTPEEELKLGRGQRQDLQRARSRVGKGCWQNSSPDTGKRTSPEISGIGSCPICRNRGQPIRIVVSVFPLEEKNV